jgi:enoyl-CoA hydratase/carnithine racemase
MEDLLCEEATPGVTILRLNRPARLNALTDTMVTALGRRLETIANSPACRVVILTGAGRAFCAGFDLSLAGDPPNADLGAARAWSTQQEHFAGVVARLRSLPQPVIAAVNGHAAGAGLGLALAADIRIASRSARFNAAFVRIGLSSCDIGVSYLLPRCVGLSRAFEIMLTGRVVDADEADRIGLVSQTIDDDRLLPRAMELAALIVDNSPFGVWMTKRGMWANVEITSLQAAIELENRTQVLTRTTGDMQAAATRFLARHREG